MFTVQTGTWVAWKQNGIGLVQAGYAASHLLRRASERTFLEKGRSMLTTDIIDILPEIVMEFEEHHPKL